METKYKVGDKIEITDVGEYTKPYFRVNDIGIIIEIFEEGYKIDFNNQKNSRVVSDGFFYIYNDKYNPSFAHFKLYQEKKPRLHAAQVDDLLWNDELGICRVEQVEESRNIYPIKIISDYCTDQITLDGKKHHYSPKATFFYYTPENHYLTERPEPAEVDWSKVIEGTNVIPWDEKEPLNDEKYYETFMAYLPHLDYPFWVYYEGNATKDNARGFKFCKLAETCKPERKK